MRDLIRRLMYNKYVEWGFAIGLTLLTMIAIKVFFL